MTEIKNIPNRFPLRENDPFLKAQIFTESRNSGIPVINLKTGGKGKGEGCPHQCLYCDVNNTEEGKPYWEKTNENEFINVINNWANQGGKVIHWCGDGEPTVFKWFDTILDIAKDKGIKLEMFSTLAGLTPKQAEKLIDINAIVRVKMDTRDPYIMGKTITRNSDSKVAIPAGNNLLQKIDMLTNAREKSSNYQGQLIASIVMSQLNYKSIIAVMDWCCQKKVVPQIAYMEQVGAANKTGIEPLTNKQTEIINRWLSIKYNIDPKQIMGDNCQAKSAPIIIGDKIFLGPFGIGCEFTLREHICELNFIGTYKQSFQELEDSIKQFRFSYQNINSLINELNRIRDRQGIYSVTGTNKLLPGCGDDIEELWLLEYAATTFTSDKYFDNFIKNWVLTEEHRKWTESEINDLISQIKQNTSYEDIQ